MVAFVQKRHDELMTRVDGVLCKLEQNGQEIDFKMVADMADVSVAWLYKSPFKNRIIATRKKTPVPSSNSTIHPLQDRIAELERINQTLLAENERLKLLAKITID